MASPDWMLYARAPFALLFVLALIYVCAGFVKKFGLEKRWVGNKTAPRLAVVETLYLDPKHRLVIVRNAGREHLLLIGASGDLHIESYERKTNAD